MSKVKKTKSRLEILREYKQRRKQAEVFKLFGTIDYDEGYHYKGGCSCCAAGKQSSL